MKRLLIMSFLLLPLCLSAQWAMAPSVTFGSSKFRLGNDKEKTDGKLGFECDIQGRYHFSSIYISLGVGYYSYSSDKLLYYNELDDSYKPTGRIIEKRDADKYESVYFPLMVGFFLPDKKLSPIAEVGAAISFPSYVEHNRGERLEVRNTNYMAIAALGLRYSFGKSAVELKAKYTRMSRLFSDEKIDLYWSNLGANITYVIHL